MSGLSFLIEISIAVGALALILNGVALFLIMGLGGKINKQKDLIAFIHRRAKLEERREEKMLDKATPKRRDK